MPNLSSSRGCWGPCVHMPVLVGWGGGGGGEGVAYQEHSKAGHAGQRHNLTLQLEEYIRGQHLLQWLPLRIKWVFQPWQGTCRRRGCSHPEPASKAVTYVSRQKAKALTKDLGSSSQMVCDEPHQQWLLNLLLLQLAAAKELSVQLDAQKTASVLTRGMHAEQCDLLTVQKSYKTRCWDKDTLTCKGSSCS